MTAHESHSSMMRPAAAPSWPARLMLGLVRSYQLTLSPWLGRGCRYLPTCSEYASDALRGHGAARGGWLTLRRLLRCHPWGGHGYDPVPGLEADSRLGPPRAGSAERRGGAVGPRVPPANGTDGPDAAARPAGRSKEEVHA